jgi:hypothetical protein
VFLRPAAGLHLGIRAAIDDRIGRLGFGLGGMVALELDF